MIPLNLKRETVKLVKKKQANLDDAVRVKADQFGLVLANKYAGLEQEAQNNIEVMNETVARLISEAAIKVGGKAPRQPVGIRSPKYLKKKRQSMIVSNLEDHIELAELSELIRKKASDFRNYNVLKIVEAVKNGRSIKSVRSKLGIGQGNTYAMKHKQGNVASFAYIVKSAQEFYTYLY